MKRLITASTVRQEHQAGNKRLEFSLPDSIVTPEARTVAEQLGLELVDTAAAACPASAKVSAAAAPRKPDAPDKDLAAIRAAIMAQLPAGSVPESVVEQLVEKAVREQAAAGDGCCTASTNKSGIKVVDGKTIKMGLFEGAGKENRVGIVDVVTDADGSSMGAGFMAWENCFFPWTLTYDEVDYVIEGELHVRINGETSIAKAGDVMFIPKNSSIEFGTPTRVKFLYVAYPATWADA